MEKKFIPIVRQTLGKRKRALYVHSDVFPDIDAEYTTCAKSHAQSVPTHFEEVHHPLEAAYYTETLLDLENAERRHLSSLRFRRTHPDVVAERKLLANTTLVVVNNIAPRKGMERNGEEFLCAITFSGQEIYGVPAETLSGIRDQVAALFRVPNTYFGPGCQFRSALSLCQRVNTLVHVSLF